MEDGENYSFDAKKPGEGLILAGGECGPMDVTIFVDNDNFIRAKLKKKAMKIRGYLDTLGSVIEK